MQSLEFPSVNEDHTHRLGLAIANCLTPGTVMGLSGTLGAGKTRLVQAIATGLGVEPNLVVSPTFALIQTHQGRLSLVHIDLYRVRDEDEFLELGIDEIIESDAVVVIEWADRFAELLPDDMVWVRIEVTEGERIFRLSTPIHSAMPLIGCIAKHLQT